MPNVLSPSPDHSLRAQPDHNVAEIQPLLAKAGVDAAVVMSPRNLYYLTGYPRALGQRPGYRRSACAIAFPSREPTLVTGRFQEEIALIRAWARDVVSYRDYLESPLARAAEVLGWCGLGSGRIGIESRWIPQVFYDDFVRDLPGSEVLACDEILDAAWAVKSSDEVERLERASVHLSHAIATGLAESRAGETELLVHQRILSAIRKAGTQTGWGRIVSGDRLKIPHALPRDREMTPGVQFRCEYGCTFEGYAAFIARVGVVGAPNDRHVVAHRRYLQALRELLLELRPGKRGSELYLNAHDAFARNGLGLSGSSIGQALGLGFGERPNLHAEEDFLIKPGQVLCIQPESADHRKVSLTIEITHDGYRVLEASDAPDQLYTIDE